VAGNTLLYFVITDEEEKGMLNRISPPEEDSRQPAVVFSRRRAIQAFILAATLVGISHDSRPGVAKEASGEVVTIPTSQVVNEDLHVAARTVRTQTRVNGDVAAAGEMVELSGPIHGYVLAAGRDVSVGGPVGNDLWAAGANVTVSAPVVDNAMLAGGTVTLTSSARVGRDAQIAAGKLDLGGPIGRNLRLAASEARLASEVRGSIQARVERLSLLPGAVVRGNLEVYGPNAPQISPEARVLGRVDYHPTASRQQPSVGAGWGWLGGWVYRFVSLLILGSAFLLLSQVWTDRVAEVITLQPGASILTGLVGLIVVPIVCLPILITLVGAPLALLLLAIYSVVWLLSGVFVAYWLGRWLLVRSGSPEASPFARLAVGALVLTFFSALPLAGWLVRSVVAMVGFGALVLERRDLLLRLRAQGLA
jgi:hypothetical protein